MSQKVLELSEIMAEKHPFKRGSEWRKWDLHVHTPASLVHHYGGNDDVAWESFISDLENLPTEFSVIGINDYLFIDGYKKVINSNHRKFSWEIFQIRNKR